MRGDRPAKTLPPAPPIRGGHSITAPAAGVRASGGCPPGRPVRRRVPRTDRPARLRAREECLRSFDSLRSLRTTERGARDHGGVGDGDGDVNDGGVGPAPRGRQSRTSGPTSAQLGFKGPPTVGGQWGESVTATATSTATSTSTEPLNVAGRRWLLQGGGSGGMFGGLAPGRSI